MNLRKLLLRLVVGRERAEEIDAARIGRSPDREVMRDTYLPGFAAAGGRILWVGTRTYTADYPALLEKDGAEVWTTDVSPRAERWGRSGRHRTGDIKQADTLFGDLVFDAVLLNGVLGWGVDTHEDQKRALEAAAAILRPGGLLLIGWNTDRIADPIDAGLTAARYEPAPFGATPSRVVVPKVTHVYDIFVRRPDRP